MYTQKDLVKSIKTGKKPHRLNLFKHLFKLVGKSELYDRVVFTDGFNGKRPNRAVIQLHVDKKKKAYKLITSDILQKMNDYVNGIRISSNVYDEFVTFHYYRDDVNWPKIDEELKKAVVAQ